MLNSPELQLKLPHQSCLTAGQMETASLKVWGWGPNSSASSQAQNFFEVSCFILKIHANFTFYSHVCFNMKIMFWLFPFRRKSQSLFSNSSSRNSHSRKMLLICPVALSISRHTPPSPGGNYTNSQHLLSTYYTPGSILSTYYALCL